MDHDVLENLRLAFNALEEAKQPFTVPGQGPNGAVYETLLDEALEAVNFVINDYEAALYKAKHPKACTSDFSIAEPEDEQAVTETLKEISRLARVINYEISQIQLFLMPPKENSEDWERLGRELDFLADSGAYEGATDKEAYIDAFFNSTAFIKSYLDNYANIKRDKEFRPVANGVNNLYLKLENLRSVIELLDVLNGTGKRYKNLKLV